ncbi:MAG: VIT1/CCC1 transporter family protein, partial [Zestosphaera sp.]
KRKEVEPKARRFKKVLNLMLLKFAYRVFGLGFVIKLLEHDEVRAVREYLSVVESGELDDHEVKLLVSIAKDEVLHENVLKKEEELYKTFLEHVREIVLGMNDGLVEVLSVSAGLAGTFVLPLYVFIGGTLVGIGGALSMGIGAYISSKTSTQIANEKMKYLQLLSAVKSGYSSGELGTSLTALDIHIGNEEASRDPKKAGLFTGLSYLSGSLVPLLPYVLLIPPPISVVLSFVFSAAALGLTGFIISILGGLEAKRKILELIALGMIAATITYFIGRIANILLGIEI